MRRRFWLIETLFYSVQEWWDDLAAEPDYSVLGEPTDEE
jgi:hypothetical protein